MLGSSILSGVFESMRPSQYNLRSLFKFASFRGIQRLILAVFVAQAAYWFIFVPTVLHSDISRPTDIIQTYDFEFSRIISPTLEVSNSAEFERLEKLPDSKCCEPGYAAVRYKFDLEVVPRNGLALHSGLNGDNVRIFVNQGLIYGDGEMTLPSISYHGQRRDTIRIPAGVLREGRNEVTTILVRDAIPYFNFYYAIIQNYDDVSDKVLKRDLALSVYRHAMTTMCLVVGFFAFLAAINTKNRFPFWLFVLATSWSLHSIYFTWHDFPIRGMARLSYFYVTSLGVSAAWYYLLESWVQKPSPFTRRLIATIFLAGTIIIVFCLIVLPSGTGYDLANSAHNWLSLLIVGFTVARLAISIDYRNEERVWEFAVIILILSLIVYSLLTEQFSGLTTGHFVSSQPVLIAALASAFLSRNFELFQSAGAIQAALEERLKKKAMELEEVQKREREIIRRVTVHEERRRIMSDMHDGIGSTLMSLLLAVRHGRADNDFLTEGIQTVIDELRLLINSMDSVGESLSATLDIFRERISDKLERAGFAFNWRSDVDGDWPQLGSRASMHVFRILQEAINNSIKHSGGTKIQVSVTDSEKSFQFHVADDGVFKDAAESRGKGMASILRRAKEIGGDVSWDKNSAGTTMVLTLPRKTLADDSRLGEK